MIVEVPSSGRHWAEPVDISADELIKQFEEGTIGETSDHLHGISFGFADGSVHFINESISPEVLKALTTKAGQEVIPAGF